jgi:hypothetical protein
VRVLRLTVVGAAALVALTACGAVNGRIDEVETGRNGVKVEVRDGTGSYEAYLIPNTTCEEGDYIQDCADRDDYLVAPANARPGRNR